MSPPGFTGVSAGDWRTLDENSDKPEVYLRFGTDLLYIGVATPEIKVAAGRPPGDVDLGYTWSVGDHDSVAIDGGGNVWKSETAGKSWGSIPSAQPVMLARAVNDLFSWDATHVQHTVTGGTTWATIWSVPSAHEQIVDVRAAEAWLYVLTNKDDLPDGLQQPIHVMDFFGGSESLITDLSRFLIGQVDDGMMAIDGNPDLGDAGDTLEADVVRVVGAGKTSVTGLPPSFGDSFTPEDEFHTYAGAACHGTTAICVATTNVGATNDAILYRSTDKGLTWTQIKRWTLDNLAHKFGQLEIAYKGDADDGIWWVGGAADADVIGLWRSEDDGLTWTLIPCPPEITGSFRGNAPAIVSAGRPEHATR